MEEIYSYVHQEIRVLSKDIWQPLKVHTTFFLSTAVLLSRLYLLSRMDLTFWQTHFAKKLGHHRASTFVAASFCFRFAGESWNILDFFSLLNILKGYWIFFDERVVKFWETLKKHCKSSAFLLASFLRVSVKITEKVLNFWEKYCESVWFLET